MKKENLYVLVALSLVAGTGYSAQERSIRVQNTVRVGYDDNIYQSDDKSGSGFISDIVNLTGKLTFSSRTDMILYWQPEVMYRFDADPTTITYQDLYGRFNHAINQRTFLQVSDRLRYQDKDGQSDGNISSTSQSYIENNLMGAVDYTLNALSQVKVGGGYDFRQWDDAAYGTGTQNNDYDQLTVDGTYIRELRPNTTQGIVGMNYADLTFEGDRGGYKSTTIFGGLDHNFNPNLIGNIRGGASMSTVDGQGGYSTDTTSPYGLAGLEFNPTARTSFNGTMGYSLSRSENSGYNAQDRFNMGLGVRHDLTGKISLSSSLSYIHSMYDSSYSRDPNGSYNLPDATDNFYKFALRASYQINRNNFVDAGYEHTERTTDSANLTEYDRNRIDIGWRLRL